MATGIDKSIAYCSDHELHDAVEKNQSMNYFLVFLQSNLLETPVYFPFLFASALKQKDFFTALTIVTAMNAITHPIVFFFIMNLKRTFLLNILTAECFAIVAESWMLYKISGEKYRSCLFASLCANFFSWQISPMLTYSLYAP
jgi:hypothetical protein